GNLGSSTDGCTATGLSLAMIAVNMANFEGKLQKAMERVKLLLEAEKSPQLPVNVHHTYEDKFSLVERASNLALSSQLNLLGSLGLDPPKLKQIHTWAQKSAVSLRFRSKESCNFLREETREVEDPTKRVNEISVGGMNIGLTSKTVNKVTEYFWRFEFSWELEALRGVGAEQADRLVVQSRSSSCELKTGSKVTPHPEVKSPAQTEEVNISFLLRHISDLSDVPVPNFSVERTAKTCRTPRRNAEVEDMEKYLKKLGLWGTHIETYLTELARKCRPTERPLHISSEIHEVFVPVLPLFVQSPGSEELVVSNADSNRLLVEESRLLAEQRQRFQEAGKMEVTAACAGPAPDLQQAAQARARPPNKVDTTTLRGDAEKAATAAERRKKVSRSSLGWRPRMAGDGLTRGKQLGKMRKRGGPLCAPLVLRYRGALRDERRTRKLILQEVEELVSRALQIRKGPALGTGACGAGRISFQPRLAGPRGKELGGYRGSLYAVARLPHSRLASAGGRSDNFGREWSDSGGPGERFAGASSDIAQPSDRLLVGIPPASPVGLKTGERICNGNPRLARL
ncbi:unnamed protein product, partial [Effrenium voratum]